MRFFFTRYHSKNPSLHLLHSLSNRLKNKREKEDLCDKNILNLNVFRDYLVSVAHTTFVSCET